MDSGEQTTDVLVIGAGMAGLIAATELKRAGRRVRVLDKGRGPGGRMATRRLGGATLDHGAQFITARDPRFAALLEAGMHAGAVAEWCRGFDGAADGHPRWRGTPSMSAVARHLAAGLDLHLEQPVAVLRRVGDQWCAETDTGHRVTADAVVLTPPVPQSLAMLDAGGVPLPTELRTRLDAIEYERCLAILAVLDGPSRVPPPGGLALTEGPVAWIADNQQKGVSAEPAVTLHSTHTFGLEHWERDRQEAGQILLKAAAEWVGAGVRSFQVHGWRYSRPMRVEAAPCVIASRSPTLVFAGDAFGGPRVEGAALSGCAAAGAILNSPAPPADSGSPVGRPS